MGDGGPHLQQTDCHAHPLELPVSPARGGVMGGIIGDGIRGRIDFGLLDGRSGHPQSPMWGEFRTLIKYLTVVDYLFSSKPCSRIILIFVTRSTHGTMPNLLKRSLHKRTFKCQNIGM